MARAAQRTVGRTAVGERLRRAVQGMFHVETGGMADKPSLLVLDAVSDAGVVTSYYLWVDSTGDLRISNAIPTNQDADGTVVGTQS